MFAFFNLWDSYKEKLWKSILYKGLRSNIRIYKHLVGWKNLDFAYLGCVCIHLLFKMCMVGL